jgi:hypothetical protein
MVHDIFWVMPIIFFGMYFLPTIIAAVAKRHNLPAIAAVNVFLGWTVLGWIVAFVWALVQPAPTPVIYVQQPPRTDDPRNSR